MKHLDRYLETIGIFLPKEQKDDILKELSENILSKMEDKEAELGRQLIGPELFPLYTKVLALNIAIALATAVTLNITLHLPAEGTFSRFIIHAVMQSAAVTFIFALLQSYLNSHPDQWDVLNPKSPASPSLKQAGRISRLESVLQIIIRRYRR